MRENRLLSPRNIMAPMRVKHSKQAADRIRLNRLSGLILCSFFVSTGAFALEEEKTYFFEGNERSVLLCSGNSSTEGLAPLVLVFHGYGGNARSTQRRYKIEDLWPEARVVYVQGLVIPQRDDGRIEPGKERAGWQRTPGMDGDRDLKFVDYLIESLADEYNIDRNQVFASGYSNGALFTWVLLTERPHTFAAFAPIAGIDNGVLNAATVPKPVMFHIATNDSAFKFPWAQKTIRRMKKLNRISGEGTKWEGNRAVNLDYTEFAHEPGGAPFVLEVNSGGHAIPSYAPKNIVKFFSQQTQKS